MAYNRDAMGDSGEGLVDAEARIHERMDELEAERRAGRSTDRRDPEAVRAIESMKLARVELVRQLERTTHPGRRAQIDQAVADLTRRIDAATAAAR